MTHGIMNKAHRFRSAALCCSAIAALLLFGCGGKSDDEKAASAADSARQTGIPLLEGSVLLDSLRADVNGDSREELIVTSRAEGGADDALLRDRFDRIDIYRQGSDGFRRLFLDVIDYGASVKCEDVTGDGILDVLVRLDAGGNDPIVAQGLHVYGLNAKGNMTLLFFSASGAPVLQDLDRDGVREILVSDQFWGMTAHSDAIGFTSTVYAFDGECYVAANEAFAGWYDAKLKPLKRAYEQARRGPNTEEGRLQLYLHAAEYLLWNYARGGRVRVRELWHAEQLLLRQRLSEEQYDDLRNFVEDLDGMEFERSEKRIS